MAYTKNEIKLKLFLKKIKDEQNFKPGKRNPGGNSQQHTNK